MTTTTVSPARATTKMRVGLVLTVLLGLANLPFLFQPTPDGQDGPPYAVLVLSAVLAVISIGAAIPAWRTGSRVAVRIAAACVIVNAVTTLPAFFVDVDASIKLAAAAIVLVSVLAVVLMLSRSRPAVTD